MIRPRALVAATAANVVTLGVLLVATDVVLLGPFAGGLVAGVVVGERRDGAVTGGLAAVLAPPVGAALAALLTVLVLVVASLLGSSAAVRGVGAAAFGVAALGPILGLTALLVYAVSLLVFVPIGILGGVVGAAVVD
ncbi:hypothetical protein [Halosimplex salinum]|uniref:hypothetical protein n=1 Tax=Halosimplex salinum TaxID=1710538 RepID=UPI0013DE3F72|nr:hypothetical protein [Halosimplex salinum]